MATFVRTPQGIVYQVDPRTLGQGDGAILRALIADPDLEEVMRNGNGEPLAVVHRQYGCCQVNTGISEEACHAFGLSVARQNDRELSDREPILDGVLPDGSRINLVIPPVARRGVSFTIRKFHKRPLTIVDLVSQGLPLNVASFLWVCIEGLTHKPANALIVGGTGSGKTATLSALSYLIPAASRCVLIEDTPELRLPHQNTVSLVTTKTQSMVELMRSSLRMRPERIIVGEVRGSEAKVLFEAMNTGHDGCLGTLHANSARESMHRIRSEPMNIPLAQCVGLGLVIVQKKLPDGSRSIVEIAEIAGFGEDVVRMNQIFAKERGAGPLASTGVPSRLIHEVARSAGLSAAQLSHLMQHRESMLHRATLEKIEGGDLLAFLSASAKM